MFLKNRTNQWMIMGAMLLTGLALTGSLSAAEDDAPLNMGGVSGSGGTIKGIVKYGNRVSNSKKKIDMSTDKFCATAHPDGVPDQQHRVFGKNGEDNTLQNVFIWVSKGVDAKTAPAPEREPALDQHGCLYAPHVSGLVAGQTLQILTSDNTTHNVNMTSKKNGKFNQSMPPNSKPLSHEFTKEEIGKNAIKFKCDVHTWMNAWMHVVEHPYFAVTQEDGTFEIHGLPPGEYELSTWHEYKSYIPDQETYTVTVPDGGESSVVVITYKTKPRGGQQATEGAAPEGAEDAE